MIVTAQLSGLLDEETFHEYVSKKLNFPGHYGFNTDALWDCLTDFSVSQPDNTLRIEGLDDFRKNNKSYAEKIISCFQDLEKEPYEHSITYSKDSSSGDGISH